jgi:putative addiction module component (TIGR02574 family)
MNKHLDEILKLSISEKLLAVEALWDDIAHHNEELPLTEEQIMVLEDRLESYKANPKNIRSWESFKKEFLGKK